jgi:hypothetical protein
MEEESVVVVVVVWWRLGGWMGMERGWKYPCAQFTTVRYIDSPMHPQSYPPIPQEDNEVLAVVCV